MRPRRRFGHRRAQDKGNPGTEADPVMYKNIIFDLGGVVIDFNPRDFLLDYFMNKTAEDAVYDLTFGSKEWEDLDAGLITRARRHCARHGQPHHAGKRRPGGPHF